MKEESLLLLSDLQKLINQVVLIDYTIIILGGVHMNPQLKKGVLELCVLSQLTKEDKYGYELTDAISREMSIAAGTLYMILKRLKEAGYVETYLQESASGPARKYYHLTEAGTAYQQEKKQEWLDFTQQINRLISDETI